MKAKRLRVLAMARGYRLKVRLAIFACFDTGGEWMVSIEAATVVEACPDDMQDWHTTPDFSNIAPSSSSSEPFRDT